MRVPERQTGFLGLFVVLSILYCPLLGAAMIHVPGDQPTIQEGIDAAQNGDTVLVAAGTWVENINFQGKSISVTSESGPAVTTIESGAFRSVVTFAGGETLDALLEGFTITGGSGTEINGDVFGGGILCRLASSPTISGNIIFSNSTLDGGGGIACIEQSAPLIAGNTIRLNDAIYNGGGIVCRDSSPVISDNTISRNSCFFGGGVPIYGLSSQPQVTGNTISYNEAEYVGAGVICSQYSSPTLANNIIQGNISQGEGGGINCNSWSTPLITGNLITGNRAGFGPNFGGAGIVVWLEAFATITNNTVTNNVSGHEGGGIWITDSGYASISGNIITGNSAVYSRGGGICFSVPETFDSALAPVQDGAVPTDEVPLMAVEYGPSVGSGHRWETGEDSRGGIREVVNNLVLGNVGSYGGGIHRSNAGTVPLINNTIIGNTSGGGIDGETGPTIRNNIVRGNFPTQIDTGIVATYCNVEGGWPGTGNIDADPLFVTGSQGEFYLSQIAAGQDEDSPCVDAGRPDSGMIIGTTRTDGVQDGGVVDMGFHYPLTDGVYICYEPSSLNLHAELPSGTSAIRDLSIWSCGNELLEWSVSSEAEWLTLDPRSGYSEGEVDLVTVGVDVDAVAPGSYETAIRILGIGAENSPQWVPVSLNVSYLGNIRMIVGPGPAPDNQPLVRVFRPYGETHLYEFNAYGPPHFGVNVSTGDVDGDFGSDILTGAGPGAVFGPHVRGFHEDGTPMPGLSFLAYGTNKYGVNVAAGDLDGDAVEEIITGAGPGAVFGPHVRAFSYDGSAVAPVPGVSFFAYGTQKWGVNVAAGDIDGDGMDEIVTGAGPGAVFGSHVRGWNVDGGVAAAIPGVSFFAYGTPRYGVEVACGDVDGDGTAEIITAPGPSPAFGAHVRGWKYNGVSTSEMTYLNFFAWPPEEARYGAKVWAATELTSGARDNIVVGPGPDPSMPATVRVYSYLVTYVSLDVSLDAFDPDVTHGANVAAGVFSPEN